MAAGSDLPRRVPKPWGHEEIWAETSAYMGKILVMRAGHRLSLQHHQRKDETIRVASGEILLTLEDDHGALQHRRMVVGDVARIAAGRRHRMRAVTDAEILEVSTPEADDVIRHEDDYGRA